MRLGGSLLHISSRHSDIRASSKQLYKGGVTSACSRADTPISSLGQGIDCAQDTFCRAQLLGSEIGAANVPHCLHVGKNDI
jgi:hypothetical protein